MFKFADTPFDETLLFASSVVFGVFFQITVFTRFGDRFNDARAVFAFQFFKFGAQCLLAFFGHGDLGYHVFLC